MNAPAVSLTVNGRPVEIAVPARTHLADALRDTLGLTGTHLGCEHGVCGACTLMVDGCPQRACLTLAAGCDGAEVRTIEGYGDDPVMATLRDQFSEHHALQCGYCTPGMLATGYDIVRRLPGADEARIRAELAGNLCRCTGYVGIVRAIQATLAAFPAGHPVRTAAAQPVEPTTVEHAARIATGTHAASAATAPVRTAEAGGMTALSRAVPVDLPVAELWRVLRDIERVAACLPGAALTSAERPDSIAGTFTVAVGPMRATFDGTAAVTWDDATRSGLVTGRGRDKLSRSGAQGEVRFAAEPDGDGAILTVAIRYAVTGPFAQFSRGALVAEVVSRLLGAFADNLVRAARDEPVAAARAVNAAGLGASALGAIMTAWFRKFLRLFRS